MKVVYKKTVCCFFVLIPALVCTGCETIETGVNGVWSGTTQQGYDISFTVRNDVIVELSFVAAVAGDTCDVEAECLFTGENLEGQGAYYYRFSFIVDKSFDGVCGTQQGVVRTVSESVPGRVGDDFEIIKALDCFVFAFNGTFDSENHASGTLRCVYVSLDTPYPCRGIAQTSWEATN